MEQTILLLDEVATLLRVSKSTINRWLAERRKGIRGNFPLPISLPGGKIRWLASDIDAYLQSQATQQPPINIPTCRQRHRNAKTFQERQAAADKALERHRSPKREG
jgi:predicted DNA-binding transcriptional regulator AlpA